MRQFIHDLASPRIIFGYGARSSLREEIERLGCRRALLISTLGQADAAANAVNDSRHLITASFNGAVMHTPTDVTQVALSVVVDAKADCLLCVGGGSTTGLAKAIALHTGLPIIALPTTYAGSEVTSIVGQTEDGAKTTMRDPVMLPKVVIYDAALTQTLPRATSITSALNAAAHAVEALYAADRTPLTDAMALGGLEAIGRSLPLLAAGDDGVAVRDDLLCGAWLCGSVLGATSMGLHHKLCHTLGGALNLPHAETHSLLLGQVAAFNQPGAPEAIARAKHALGIAEGIDSLFVWIKTFGVQMALADFGVEERALDHVADLAVQSPYANPVQITREGIRALLGRAYSGFAPTITAPLRMEALNGGN